MISSVWHHQKDVRCKITLRKETSSTKRSPKKLVLNPSFFGFFHWNTALKKSRPPKLESGLPSLDNRTLGNSTCPKCQEPRSVTGLKLIGEEAPEMLGCWLILVRFWEGTRRRKVVKDSLGWMGFFGDSLHQKWSYWYTLEDFFGGNLKQSTPIENRKIIWSNPLSLCFKMLRLFKGCKLPPFR